MSERRTLQIRLTALVRAGLSIAIAASSLHAQTGFNGTVTFVMHGKSGHDQVMTQAGKGDRLRVDVQDPNPKAQMGGGMIFDAAAKTITVLMDQQKMYMVMSTNDMKRTGEEMAASMPQRGNDAQRKPAAAPDAGKIKVDKTGRTETVAGISCDVYSITGTTYDKPVHSEVCAAKGVGFAPMQMGAGGMMGKRPNVPDMGNYADLLKENRGVLKVTSFESGKPFVELEATKVDRSTPSDALFVPPPGYTKFQMPAMPNMPGMPKRPPPA